MAGTKAGGQAAAATNKKKYGDDYYKLIGTEGGKNGKGPGYTGGFAAGEAGRERARIYGVIGGKTSRRTANKG